MDIGNLDIEEKLTAKLMEIDKETDSVKKWDSFKQILAENKLDFEIHHALYKHVFSGWSADIPKPAWTPSSKQIEKSNIGKIMNNMGFNDYRKFHAWSVDNREDFWKMMVEKLGIIFDKKYDKMFDRDWLVGAKLNIVDSCFKAPKEKTAIIYKKKNSIYRVSYGELELLVNKVAGCLRNIGFVSGDRIAIDMPMTYESVAIYLGIIKTGCVVVSIADSFAPDEIAAKIRISNTKAIFTQDFNVLRGKEVNIYTKVKEANAPMAIVVFYDKENKETLRKDDISWNDFLNNYEATNNNSNIMNPYDYSNILFSSGTTGDPKAIPWTHTTPIKCASDAYLHQNITENSILAWPTNLGWMMGPWLIYAGLVNNATIALYPAAATEKDFCKFIEEAEVTMLGVVPSIVKAWKESKYPDKCNWNNIELFSSTGECSNETDYLYLMSLAGYKPIIEYLGGTEIGGGHITGTIVQYSSPATFTTPALGLDFVILDETGKETKQGELFLIPPSIGLSVKLLNKDHEKIYFEGCPRGFRRHGDEIEILENGYYKAHGRIDDTMNLGGIKTSSAEIERCLMIHDDLRDVAAIAINPEGGGPSQLVIYVVMSAANNLTSNKEKLKHELQFLIKEHLNPLFRIHDIIFVESLPRTASNKIMRRVLREMWRW